MAWFERLHETFLKIDNRKNLVLKEFDTLSTYILYSTYDYTIIAKMLVPKETKSEPSKICQQILKEIKADENSYFIMKLIWLPLTLLIT